MIVDGRVSNEGFVELSTDGVHNVEVIMGVPYHLPAGPGPGEAGLKSGAGKGPGYAGTRDAEHAGTMDARNADAVSRNTAGAVGAKPGK